LDQRRQCLAGAGRRGAQDQVGTGRLPADVVSYRFGRPFTAPAQGAVVIGQSGVAPGRFCMSQEKNGLHRSCLKKSFGNNCLLNCHDTVM
jgi:hypothetical protein